MGILGKRRGAGGAGRLPAQAEPAVWPGRRDRNDEVAKAAGVGAVRIRCHATTWDYLIEEARAHEGIVTVPLGGSSLAAPFDWYFEAQSVTRTGPERGTGRRVGRAISKTLENLAASRRRGGPAAVIRLDDRIAANSPVSVQP